MNFVVITGLSGAGISTATKIMEDMGYFCIDNLPPSLIPKIADICAHSNGKINKVCIVIDSRVGNLLNEIFTYLNTLKDFGYSYDILFLDASDEALVKRYKENRRSHPLAREGRVISGVKLERKLLDIVKSKANFIIDTSNLSPKKLKEHLEEIYMQGIKVDKLVITIISFGFKYGVPLDLDNLYDVRFIPNPFYIEEMKKLNGKDKEVKGFVLEQEETTTFLTKAIDMFEFLIPNYIKEGKTQLVIGIGCTGGQHRSVAIAEELCEKLIKNGHRCIIDHRDINKDTRII